MEVSNRQTSRHHYPAEQILLPAGPGSTNDCSVAFPYLTFSLADAGVTQTSSHDRAAGMRNP